MRLVRKLGIFDRVELPGSVPDMRGEWAKASISALTSRAEGFPLVASRRRWPPGCRSPAIDCASGPREIIEHEVNGLLVSPESVAGMAAALLRLATDDDLRRTPRRGRLPLVAAVRRRSPSPSAGSASSAPPAPGGPAPAGWPRGSTRSWTAKPVPTAADEARGRRQRHAGRGPEGGAVVGRARGHRSTEHWLVIPAHDSTRSRRGGADGRPRRLPQVARRPRRAGVPLPARPGWTTAGRSAAAPSPR